MSFVVAYTEPVRDAVVRLAPAIPQEFWWATLVVLVILALTASVDAFTATIPDALIFLGLFSITAVQGFFLSWEDAGRSLRYAVGSGLLIWGINYAWFQKFGHDALGMGDAKWTMLAVACFGASPVAIAWGIGSVLATIFILGGRAFRKRIEQVTFSPFLLIGLGLALYYLRFGSGTGGVE